MPSLSEMHDADELENRYIDKCVIYVEGPDDQTVWRHVIGSDLGDRLEFKAPAEQGGGFNLVLNRVRLERPRNAKVFGLLDGEAAAVYGRIAELIDTAEIFFTVADPAFNGIIFLAEHEVENVLLRYSDLADFIVAAVPISRFGNRNVEAVRDRLTTLARRFFVAALFKYATAQLRFDGRNCGILDVGRFRSEERILLVIREMKRIVREEALVDPSDLVRQLLSIAKLLRARARREVMEPAVKAEHLLRLADGKGLWTAIIREWSVPKTYEGIMLQKLASSEYANGFKNNLMELTGLTA